MRFFGFLLMRKKRGWTLRGPLGDGLPKAQKVMFVVNATKLSQRGADATVIREEFTVTLLKKIGKSAICGF